MKIKLIESIENIFPNSKIKDILYNGSEENYSEIDFSKINVHDDGYLGKGFYLSADKTEAQSYGRIVKEFYVNCLKPFCFNTISPSDISDLSHTLSNTNVKACRNFIYWLTRLSDNESLKYLGSKIKEDNASQDDIIYGFEIILNNPQYVLDGALMDFSDGLTSWIKSKGFDSAYINNENIEYFEVVIYNKNQVYLIS